MFRISICRWSKPQARGEGRGALGGYTRAVACKRLSANHGMIASFSRALAEELKHSMSDAEFDAALAKSIDEIYQASTVKV